MNEPPENRFLVRQWIERAEHDLTNAEHALSLPEEKCPFDTICFHAQQCAEKYLKALLTLHSIDSPKTHDLVVLFALVKQSGTVLSLEVSDLQPLNRYPIEARYPGDWEPIGREEANEALAIAKTVREQIGPLLEKAR